MTTNNHLLFIIGQEVTPICKGGRWGRIFGKVFHVDGFQCTNGYWYVTLAECPRGTIEPKVEEWWAQEGLAPVLPAADLNKLLCEVEMANVNDKPVILLDY